jgi:hypothetical protein
VNRYERQRLRALTDPDLVIRNGRLYYLAGPHGSPSTYNNRKCRCEECRAAHAADVGRRWAERAERLKTDPTLAPHGKATTYSNWGCRCDPCAKAFSAAQAGRDARRNARRKVATP